MNEEYHMGYSEVKIQRGRNLWSKYSLNTFFYVPRSMIGVMISEVWFILSYVTLDKSLPFDISFSRLWNVGLELNGYSEIFSGSKILLILSFWLTFLKELRVTQNWWVWHT